MLIRLKINLNFCLIHIILGFFTLKLTDENKLGNRFDYPIPQKFDFFIHISQILKIKFFNFKQFISKNSLFLKMINLVYYSIYM